jgi:hypothetical protein
MKKTSFFSRHKNKFLALIAGMLIAGSVSIGYVGWNSCIHESQKHFKHIKRKMIRSKFKHLIPFLLVPFLL